MTKKYQKDYPDIADQIDYTFQHTGGDIQLALEPYIVPETADPFLSLDNVLEYIADIYEDHNPKQTADIALAILKQGA